MARLDACLLDAYDTIVYTDFSAHRNELPKLAGISADAMFREFRRLAPALSVGEISITGAYAEILQACGVEPRPGLVRALADKSRGTAAAVGAPVRRRPAVPAYAQVPGRHERDRQQLR